MHVLPRNIQAYSMPNLPRFASLLMYASCRADELDADIRTVRAGDEAAAVRRLETAIKTLRVAFKEIKGLVQGTEQAAAKCEVSLQRLLQHGSVHRKGEFQGKSNPRGWASYFGRLDIFDRGVILLVLCFYSDELPIAAMRWISVFLSVQE